MATHLKNLALWSSSEDTPIKSLATLFGRRIAVDGEASGVGTDPDLISCQRCETILQPGFNCYVKIEKVAAKKKQIKCKKNNVVYYCSFCSHHNLKRGTTKSINLSKPKSPLLSGPKIKRKMMMMFSSPGRIEKDHVENSMVNTPKPKPILLTLEREKRIRKSKCKKPMEPESGSENIVGGSKKRKR